MINKIRKVNEMLKKMNEGGVESDMGFSIQIVHPEYLEYREGTRLIPISMGYNSTNRKIYVYVTNSKELSEIEKCKVANNIKEALKLSQGEFEIV